MEYVGELVTKHFPRHGWFQGVVVEVVEVEGDLYARVEYQDGDQEDLPLKELEKVLMFPEAVKKQRAACVGNEGPRNGNKGGASRADTGFANGNGAPQRKRARGVQAEGSKQKVTRGEPCSRQTAVDCDWADIPRRKRSKRGTVVVDLGPKFSFKNFPRMFWRHCWEQSSILGESSDLHCDSGDMDTIESIDAKINSPPTSVNLSKCIDCGADIKLMKVPRRCRSCYQKEYRRNRKKRQKVVGKQDPGMGNSQEEVPPETFQENGFFKQHEEEEKKNSLYDPNVGGIADALGSPDKFNHHVELDPEPEERNQDQHHTFCFNLDFAPKQDEREAKNKVGGVVEMPPYYSFSDILSKTTGISTIDGNSGNACHGGKSVKVLDMEGGYGKPELPVNPELPCGLGPPPSAGIDFTCPFADSIHSIKVGCQGEINKDWENLPGKCSPLSNRAIPRPSKIIGHLIQSGLAKLGNRVWYRGGHGRLLAEGWIVWNGILCSRCAHVVGATEFEKCAGMKARKPGRHIMFPCGRSLVELTRVMEGDTGIEDSTGDLAVGGLDLHSNLVDAGQT